MSIYDDINTTAIDWEEATRALLETANKRHKGAIQIVYKNATWYWHAMHILISCVLKVLTGFQGKWHYDNYWMTFGRTLFVPPKYNWEYRWGTIRHEIAHFDDMTFGDPGLGSHWDGRELKKKWGGLWMLWYGLKYLWGCPLPIKYARFRARCEYFGYLQQVRQSVWEHRGKCSPKTKLLILKQFVGPGYVWMSTEAEGKKWVDTMVAQAESEWNDGIIHIRMFGLVNPVDLPPFT